MPDFLWADAGAVATYLINRTVSASSGGLTPYEAFYGTRPSISHMRVWYCDVFIHHDKSLGARKLGERGKLVKFLGYPENVSGYRTYDPIGKKVEMVRAPTFREEARPTPNVPFESSPSDSESNTDDAAASPMPTPPPSPHTTSVTAAPPPPPPPSLPPNIDEPRPQHT